MTGTFTLDLTEKEYQLILAERKREADELRKAKQEENNKASETNREHFEKALRAIKSTIEIFDYERSHPYNDTQLVQGKNVVETREAIRRLLFKLEAGMEALVDMADNGLHTSKSESKTLLAAFDEFPKSTRLIVIGAIRKMRTADLKNWKKDKGESNRENGQEEGATKRKRL